MSHLDTFDTLPEGRQMEHLRPEEQAVKALKHLLERVRNHPHVGWYLGYGTQSFDLLTEAYASLTGTPVRTVREQYEPRNPTNPRGDA